MRITLALALGILVIGIALPGSNLYSEDQAEESPFKTVHIFNLKQGTEESELLEVLAKFNRLFVHLGCPESKYRLWRVTEEREGQRRYLWESNWSSRDVYEKVHADKEYRKLLREEFGKLATSLKDHLYDQYKEVPIVSAGE